WSAQALRPKALCKAGSERRRGVISQRPCAPARIGMKAAVRLLVGGYFPGFWAIFTLSRTRPNRSIWRRCRPRARRLAAGEKCRVASKLINCVMVMNLLRLDMMSHQSVGSSLPVVHVRSVEHAALNWGQI